MKANRQEEVVAVTAAGTDRRDTMEMMKTEILQLDQQHDPVSIGYE